jgi:hypothetical protein
MEIEGAPGKRFRVYRCDINNEPHTCEGEYDTVAEVIGHRWNAGRRYKISVGRKFFTRLEFSEWVKTSNQD